MTRPTRQAPPAFLFFGVFTGFDGVFPRVRELILERYGPLHPRGESPAFPFPTTRTYEPTMGSNLRRKFFVLDALWPQDGLASVKHHTGEMEELILQSGEYPVERPVNIDPGILNDCRIVLASTKDYAHRLYRGDGIWEEITLCFKKGEYCSLPWTYPDFRAPEYHAFFKPFRLELLERWKALGSEAAPPASRP